ncbi:sugar ABC transporter substrate-binding protein [Diplocloster hominis]|uniref:ABC transporter substrate-binding protein n=1 Tax=Diplocloster hominis TaxID=3079010 RepID=UPI0031B9BA0E
MMKRRWLSVLLTACLAAGILSGCGTKAEETAAPDEADTQTQAPAQTAPEASPAAAEGSVGGSLVIWEHTAQFEEPLKAVIEGFNAKYPDVEVEYQIKTSDQYYNLLQTAIQAGDAPDLFWTNGTATTNMQTYAKEGVLMDLTDLVDFSLYEGSSAMSICTIDGKVWSTPTAEVGGRACFYNKDIFKEVGIEVPKTFSEFDSSLEKIAAAGYVPIAFGASDPWEILFQFEPLLAAMHIDWLDEYQEKGTVAVNDKRVVEVFEKMLEWADKGYYGVGYTGIDGSGALLALSTGKAAMCIDGTWNVQTIQENNPDLNLGAFQVPCEDGTRPFVGTNSNGFSINAKTENPDAAVAFANYFASLEGQTAWLNVLNSVPMTEKIVSSNEVINEIARFDKQVESYYSILGYLEGDGESPRNIWEEDQTKVFSGGLTPQEFTDELQALLK